jgi:hypothetical protein
MSSAAKVVISVLVVAGIIGGYVWWRRRQPPAPLPPVPVVQPAPPPPAPPPPPDAAAPTHYPIEAGKPATPLPGLDDADAYLKNALIDLLGRKGVLSFLNVDGFARHFVATVDNLGNERAPVAMWPVNPMAGAFEADSGAVAERNADRYAAFIRFAEAVDTRKAVALYVRVYPLFQQAYEELGYPGKYFNDRVVEVIDQLLATPDLPDPIKVRRVEVPGAPRTARAIYQFEDPSLESRSAGQKILLRMGHANARRLKDKLSEIRAAVATGTRRLSPK